MNENSKSAHSFSSSWPNFLTSPMRPGKEVGAEYSQSIEIQQRWHITVACSSLYIDISTVPAIGGYYSERINRPLVCPH